MVCGGSTKYRSGSGNAAILDGARGAILYKYETFKKTLLSHIVDNKPTSDITRRSGQKIARRIILNQS